MALLLLFRLPIICTLLNELKDFRVIVHTGKLMFSPFMSVLFSLYLVIFAFNAVGIIAFSGVVRLSEASTIASVASPLYYQLNFNDTYSGLMTLFSILVGNNWNSTTDMYAALVGANWPRFYFSLFFVVSIMVMMNIIVSFVLEIYTVSLEESQAKLLRAEKARKISKACPTEDELKELIRKAALYDKLVSSGGDLSVSSSTGSGDDQNDSTSDVNLTTS